MYMYMYMYMHMYMYLYSTCTCTVHVHVHVKVLHVYTCSYVSEVTFLTFLPAAMGRVASTSERTSSLSLSAVSALWVGGEEVVDETLCSDGDGFFLLGGEGGVSGR